MKSLVGSQKVKLGLSPMGTCIC